jgi:hypothetical protein
VLVIWAILGIISLSWTTLMYAIVFPGGSSDLTGFDAI